MLFGIFILFNILKKIRIELDIRIKEIIKYWGIMIKLKNESVKKKITKFEIKLPKDIW